MSADSVSPGVTGRVVASVIPFDSPESLDAAFAAAARAQRGVVVCLSATWCRPCKTIAPVYEALAASPSVPYTCLKTTELDDDDLMAHLGGPKYGVTCQAPPLFAVFDWDAEDGKHVLDKTKSWKGASKERLEALLSGPSE